MTKQQSKVWKILGIIPIVIAILSILLFADTELRVKPAIENYTNPMKWHVLENNKMLRKGLKLSVEDREEIRVDMEKYKAIEGK